MKKLFKVLAGIMLALLLAQLLVLKPNGMTLKSWVPGESVSGLYCEECCCDAKAAIEKVSSGLPGIIRTKSN